MFRFGSTSRSKGVRSSCLGKRLKSSGGGKVDYTLRFSLLRDEGLDHGVGDVGFVRKGLANLAEPEMADPEQEVADAAL